jgi:hypothetical protein
MLGFGTAPQPVINPENYFATCALPLGSGFANGDAGYAPLIQGFACSNSVPRLPNRNPRDSGQFGVAMHWYAENWGNTDFGFYFLNYHSRLPLLSGRTVGTSALTGTPVGLSAGFFVEYPEDIQMYGMSWNTTLRAAWPGRARSATARTCRCRSTTSSCCSPR